MIGLPHAIRWVPHEAYLVLAYSYSLVKGKLLELELIILILMVGHFNTSDLKIATALLLFHLTFLTMKLTIHYTLCRASYAILLTFVNTELSDALTFS